jgi:pimeloyl-ACP methyl ester carboxylesterase
MSSTTPPPTVTRVRVDGAELHVETRGNGPAVVLFGCPMDAEEFAPLAERLATDHTVVTTDPRGIKRSTVADRQRDVTPEVLADDLRAVLRHLDRAPVSVFGSSGGAVAALALAQQHPELVDIVVAHEPPLEGLLPDRDQLREDTEAMVRCYLDGDITGAWRRFFESAHIVMPEDALAAWLDNRTDPQELADEHFFFARTLRPTTYWQPDLTVLGSRAQRIVVGVGADSVGQVCDRTTAAFAAALAITPTTFVGDHTGFVDHPALFADQLRAVLRAEPLSPGGDSDGVAT